MRVGLFTNNYLPFRGGVTTAVETVRRGLAARGHGAWVFAPAFAGTVSGIAPAVVVMTGSPNATASASAMP